MWHFCSMAPELRSSSPAEAAFRSSPEIPAYYPAWKSQNHWVYNRKNLMKLFFQGTGFHRFLSCQHLVCISADRIDFPIVYHKTVRMRSLPAWICIRTETGMYQCDCRLIIRILKIRIKMSEAVPLKTFLCIRSYCWTWIPHKCCHYSAQTPGGQYKASVRTPVLSPHAPAF